MSDRPRIEVRGVAHRYARGGCAVLSNVGFDIQPAERVAIIGRSGCGKSTLLQFIAGLARPTSGRVTIGGVDAVAASARCKLMFQRPLLFPWLTVAQNVALALRFAGRGREAAARVAELSGGQQQRVALARSLAVEPDALLLDEPFSALDIVTRAGLRQEMRKLLDALSMTFVIVTHDVDDALDLADRVIVMAAAPGRIMRDIRLPKSFSDDARREFRALLVDALEPEPAPLALSA